jgi:heme/copper-type cytochrome/quinol oxidase subunit 4
MILLTIVALLLTALPVLAQEGDPLANSVLLPGVVGFALAGLAILLVVLFRLWTMRGPR